MLVDAGYTPGVKRNLERGKNSVCNVYDIGGVYTIA
jgi:hypothetical protein